MLPRVLLQTTPTNTATRHFLHCHRGGKGSVSFLRLTISRERSLPDCDVGRNTFTARLRAGVLRSPEDTLTASHGNQLFPQRRWELRGANHVFQNSEEEVEGQLRTYRCRSGYSHGKHQDRPVAASGRGLHGKKRMQQHQQIKMYGLYSHAQTTRPSTEWRRLVNKSRALLRK